MANEQQSNAPVFLYTEGAAVPRNVTRVRVDPSVTMIPDSAFRDRFSLQSVEMPTSVTAIRDHAFMGCWALSRVELPDEGIEEIGAHAFDKCHKLRYLHIPRTVRSIGRRAFWDTSLQAIDLPDGLESIGEQAFGLGVLTNIRIPPSVAELHSQLQSCGSVFSVELPMGLEDVSREAFRACGQLRNVAFPPSTGKGSMRVAHMFDDCNYLKVLGSNTDIKHKLKHRFDGMPLHELVYYQSYYPVETVVENLTRVINGKTIDRRFIPRGGKPGKRNILAAMETLEERDRRDCLKMTPLHILACCKRQPLELYQLLLDNYPEDLIKMDRWGALPLLYAVWSDAPQNVIDFLLESHRRLHPDYDLDWVQMLVVMSTSRAPWTVIRKLLETQKSFQGSDLNWKDVFEKLLAPPTGALEALAIHAEPPRSLPSMEVLRALVHYSVAQYLTSIGPRGCRSDIVRRIRRIQMSRDNEEERSRVRGVIGDIHAKVEEYKTLEEGFAALELALWKAKIDDCKRSRSNRDRESSAKRVKIDEAEFRKQCRTLCGAQEVIENVIPYLVPNVKSIRRPNVPRNQV